MLRPGLLQHQRKICILKSCLSSKRWISSSSGTQSTQGAMEVMFMGRDEFSCLVLEELFRAKGESCWSHSLGSLLRCVFTDVWNRIHVVTYPDTYTGRRHSKCNVCMLFFRVICTFSCLSYRMLLAAPLKTLAESMSLNVYCIPENKRAFRAWTVRLSLSAASIT